MSAKLTEQKAKELLEETLRKYGEADQTIDKAPLTELYRALAIISHDMLVDKREKYQSQQVYEQKSTLSMYGIFAR